ncbi:MAG: hypothetical protein RSD36_12805 [Terrisporobacter sp.]
MIDACFIAKRITEVMPELPNGLKPRNIHVIDCIAELKKEKEIINKYNEKEDKRIVSLSLTSYHVEIL